MAAASVVVHMLVKTVALISFTSFLHHHAPIANME